MNHCLAQKFSFLILLAISLLWGSFAYAENNKNNTSKKIAIFYPQAKEPYNSIYQNIIAGSIKAAEQKDKELIIKKFILKKDFNGDEIAKKLEQEHITKVIVLGRSGWRLAKQLAEITLDDQSKKFHVVSGALPIRPNGISGISLITDPSYLFEYLTQIAPDVKNIHVAYSKKSSWLIELAKSAAQQKGLTLNLQQVSNTAEAILFYQKIFKSQVSNKDAIWLPFDRVSSHDKVTLPLILEKAWTKEVVVFSSKPSHAKRGALFSTYPDNFALGQHLFTMVHELEQQPNQKNFAALKSTLLAVNLRTAAHLGFKYSSEQRQSFKLTFPQ